MNLYGLQPQDQAGLDDDGHEVVEEVDPALEQMTADEHHPLGLVDQRQQQQQQQQLEQQHQHAQLLLEHQQQQLYVLPQEHLHLHHDGLSQHHPPPPQLDYQQPQHHHLLHDPHSHDDYATHPLETHPLEQQQQQPQLEQDQPAQQRSATGRRAYKSRCKWPIEDKLLVVQTLVDQRALGNQAGGGFTLSAWNAVAEALAGSELRSGGDVKGAEECRSAYSRLKREYVRVKQLRTQFPWDEINQRPAVDDVTRRNFLKDHPAYTSVFGGWPYFNEMDAINGELPTVVASVNKPLQVADHGGSGHGTREGGHFDDGAGSQSDGSESLHHQHSALYFSAGSSSHYRSSSSELDPHRPYKRMRYADGGYAGAGTAAAAAYADPSVETFSFTPNAAAVAAAPPFVAGGHNTHAAISAAAVSVFNGADIVGLTAEAEAAHAQVTATAAAMSRGDIGEPSDARVAAKSVLWSDMLSEGWSLTDRDIVFLLQRFEEEYLYAEQFVQGSTFSERLDYLHHVLAGGPPYDPALDEVEHVEGQHQHELELTHDLAADPPQDPLLLQAQHDGDEQETLGAGAVEGIDEEEEEDPSLMQHGDDNGGDEGGLLEPDLEEQLHEDDDGGGGGVEEGGGGVEGELPTVVVEGETYAVDEGTDDDPGAVGGGGGGGGGDASIEESLGVDVDVDVDELAAIGSLEEEEEQGEQANDEEVDPNGGGGELEEGTGTAVVDDDDEEGGTYDLVVVDGQLADPHLVDNAL